MRVKQAERRQREQEEELEREIQRRKHGQELQKVRQKLQDDEIKTLTEQRRKEKMEDKLARFDIDYNRRRREKGLKSIFIKQYFGDYLYTPMNEGNVI